MIAACRTAIAQPDGDTFRPLVRAGCLPRGNRSSGDALLSQRYCSAEVRRWFDFLDVTRAADNSMFNAILEVVA
jgi:hypothetical protein